MRHLEQRHQEMCQLLILARVGQAEAMEASRDAKQQLQEQLQAAQSDHQGALDELARTQTLLSTSEQEVQQQRLQLATCMRELSESGMQRFELSQTLQEAQTQLAAQLELSGKLRARAKKYRAGHTSLCKQLEAAKAESAVSSQQSAESARAFEQELLLTKERLELTMTEVTQANEAQAVLQQHNYQAEAERQQVGGRLSCTTCTVRGLPHSWPAQTVPAVGVQALQKHPRALLKHHRPWPCMHMLYRHCLYVRSCFFQNKPKYLTIWSQAPFACFFCCCCHSQATINLDAELQSLHQKGPSCSLLTRFRSSLGKTDKTDYSKLPDANSSIACVRRMLK